MTVRIAHTADLIPADHDAIWSLLVDAFKGDVTKRTTTTMPLAASTF